MIVSFYSYKGGVGRTQLCANIAAYLCHKKGKRVLLWDWDFEAPGLHFYFNKENKDITKNGTLEILEDYVSLMRSKSGIQKEDLNFVSKENIIELERYQRKDDLTEEEHEVCIDLLPAGNLNNSFSARINDFNWFEFYELLDGVNYIELLKEKIKELDYDYVFIDSRTGISDYSGICNIQLPEMNVFLMAANKQNYNGCSRIAKQIINSEYVKKGHRKPFLMPILSRLDKSHPDFSHWIDEFNKHFAFTLPLLDKNVNKDFSDDIFADVFLQETFLEYVQSISAGENVFFKKEYQRFNKVSFEQKYINIADFIQKIKEKGKIQIDEFIDKDTWIDYAEMALAKKDKVKAALAYTQAGEIDKANSLGGSAGSWFTKGDQYSIKGDKDQAIKYYLKAIEIKSDKYEAWNNMGITHHHKGDNEQAIRSYQKAIEIKPDLHEVWYNMGIAYHHKGDNEQAIKCYQKAVQIKPDKHEAWYNMGDVYADKSNKEQAIKCYQKAIEIKPDKYEAWGNIGFMHLKYGNLPLAKKKLLKSVSLGGPDFGNMNLGHIYLAQEQVEKALETYKISLSHFEDKDKFFEGFEDDYQHLVQYGVSRKIFDEVKGVLLAERI
jgi:tetratricopeptide (TPR) repeat protein